MLAILCTLIAGLHDTIKAHEYGVHAAVLLSGSPVFEHSGSMSLLKANQSSCPSE